MKMPGGRTKFSNAWLSAFDSNGQRLSSWCRKGVDDYHAYCRFCDSEFLCDNSGKAQILQHARKAKHVQAVKPARDESQGKLFVLQSQPSAGISNRCDLPEHRRSSSGQLSIINYKNASLQAEVIWLAKLASCNFSFRSVDNLGNTFKAMFPDSNIASSFSMGRSRASYVIGEGLGPHFTQVLYKVQFEYANYECIFMCDS